MDEIVDGAVSLDFSVRATDEKIEAYRVRAEESGWLGPGHLREVLGWLDVERRLVDRLLSNEGALEHVVAERDYLAARVAAVRAVLDDPGGPGSWSHTFDGRQAVFAEDVLAALDGAVS